VGNCGKCGQVHDPKRCAGHANVRADPGDRDSRIVGQRPCKQYPLHGSKVCAAHGGAKKSTKAKATQRVTEEKVRKTLGRLHIVPVENPLTELQVLGGRARAWMELCEGHVADLERLRYGTDGGEQIRGEILLFERAMDQCRRVLVDIARLNIDERLARVSERQVEVVADALAKALAEMGLTQDQQREARRAVARHLVAVPG
jgi:hypothetical protein